MNIVHKLMRYFVYPDWMIQVEQLHRIFRLCGTPADDYYRRLKLSTSLKPPKAYKSTLRETFRDFPSSSVGLLNILLAMEPAHRGSAASALQNEVGENHISVQA